MRFYLQKLGNILLNGTSSYILKNKFKVINLLCLRKKLMGTYLICF